MRSVRSVGRYALYAELASGGMATVHLGRLRGRAGFARTVAIKRLHPTFAKDPEFVSMFLDEARLAARIRHPNVVPVLDVEALDGELFLVMDYVHGESLSRLMRLAAGKPLPATLAARIAADMLYGLHAAHEAKSERGEPLEIVHRDVSPQNVLVGIDGVARVADFGIAKAVNRIQTTHEGQLKGKLSYMSPEQLEEQPVDRRTDVYAAAVVLWELLTGRRLHVNLDVGKTVTRILHGKVPAPSRVVADVPAVADQIVLKGLARLADDRFATAQEMALALERGLRPEPAAMVGEWVSSVAANALEERAALVAELENSEPSAEGDHHRKAAIELARTAAASMHDSEQATAPSGPLHERVSYPGDASSNPVAASSASEPSAQEGQSKSSITVERSLRPAPRRNLQLGLVAVAAGLALMLAVVLVLVVRRSPSTQASPGASQAAPEAPPPSAMSAPAATAEPLPPPPASVSAAAPPPSARVATRAPKPNPRPSQPAPSAKPKSAFGSLTRE